MNQLILLKEFWKWRDGSHQFIDVNEKVKEQMMAGLKGLLFKIYPDTLIRKLFDHIKNFGNNPANNFTYRQLSIELQTTIKAKFELTPV